MPYANGADGSKTVGFLDLSRELRDQIYRELLFQPIGYAAARRRHKFEIAILRVNKQIHREGSRVLYAENAWAVFEMRWPSSTLNLPTDRGLITTTRDISRYGRLPFGGNPSLRVRVQECDFRYHKTMYYVIAPLEWVGDMTVLFIPGDSSQYLEFAVHFHEYQKQESRQRMAIEFMEVIRGVRKAKITGLSSPSLGARLAEHMLTPIKSIDELIDRTSEYIRRAELMLAQGQVFLAEELYNQGYDNSVWATGSSSIVNVTPTKNRDFSSKLCESLEGGAVCCLRHRRSHSSCIKLRDYIRKNSNLPDSQKARGLYYYGLASAAQGYENEALLGFMLVLMLIPGYEAVDKEIDALEERVTKGMSPNAVRALMLASWDTKDRERSRICWNLDLVKPCRHKNASDGELSFQQKKRMIAYFESRGCIRLGE